MFILFVETTYVIDDNVNVNLQFTQKSSNAIHLHQIIIIINHHYLTKYRLPPAKHQKRDAFLFFAFFFFRISFYLKWKSNRDTEIYRKTQI